MENLCDILKKYCAGGAYPFHMPGHKRRMGAMGDPFAIDITEIDGFDNLHHAQGILKEAQEKAARLYGAKSTYYLVNGSTCGILAAVAACTSQNGKILMARNCHKAAYHAAELRGLQTVYLYPQRDSRTDKNGAYMGGSIDPCEVEAALQQDGGIEAVLITSPTYDGVVSDVRKIAETAHRFGVPLIVDEAHGAHFGFHPGFPESSVGLGADIVIHSLHKTLPSLTQTALLHLCTPEGGVCFAEEKKVRKYLNIFETSSPSYVLMAGMDACIDLMGEHGKMLFEAFWGRLRRFYKEAGQLRHVKLIEGGAHAFAFDFSKILITAEGMSGVEIAAFLREEHQLELEMAAGGYALALATVGDDDEGFARLLLGLRELDARLSTEEGKARRTETCAAGKNTEKWMKADAVCTIAEAAKHPGRRMDFSECAGKVSKEYGYLYPPGIPLLVPGERISKEVWEEIDRYRQQGMFLQGLEDYSGKTVEVFDTEDN